MQPFQILQALRRRWYATAAIVIAAVIVGAGLAASAGSSPKGTATVQILVDSPVSALVNLQANQTALGSRASVLAQAMSSDAVVSAIAKSAGVPVDEVTAQGPYTGSGESLDVPTPSEARGMQIGSAKDRYRLTIQAQQDLPIVTVGVQGPTPGQAGALANQVLAGTEAWLATLTTSSQVKTGDVVRLRQLGDAQAGSVNSRTSEIIGAIGAVAVLMLGLLAIVLTDPKRRAGRARERARAEFLLKAALERDYGAELRPLPVGARAQNGRRDDDLDDPAADEEFDDSGAAWLDGLAADSASLKKDSQKNKRRARSVSASGSTPRQG
jgi:capsular polysaccharide biosynthesis protein